MSIDFYYLNIGVVIIGFLMLLTTVLLINIKLEPTKLNEYDVFMFVTHQLLLRIQQSELYSQDELGSAFIHISL